MPYREYTDDAGVTRRLTYSKYIGGRRNRTKQASLAYWAKRTAEVMAMAKATKAETKKRSWVKVPSELNIWEPRRVGDALECMVIAVNPKGKFGLQVKVADTAGAIVTLPAHKVLQDRLEFALGKTKGKRAVLLVTFLGDGTSKSYPAAKMQLYDVEYDFLGDGELWGAETHVEEPAW